MTEEQLKIIEEALMMYSQHCVKMSLTRRFKNGLPDNATTHQKKLYKSTIANTEERKIKWSERFKQVHQTLIDFDNEQHKLLPCPSKQLYSKT